jgi:hypothetical protein
MKQWFKTKYGDAPYKDVLLVEFSFDSPSHQETAFKQYKFLLQDEVIQAHLEHETKKGIAILINQGNPEQILKKQDFGYKIISREIIPYEEVLEKNNMFE